MPEEAPEQIQDTPTPDAPVEGSAEQTQAEVDWQKRYADLQPEYTRATQESASLREQNQAWQVLTTSDDQEQRQIAAQILGLELPEEDTNDDEYVDPTDALQRKIDALEARFVQQDEAAQEQQALEAEGELIGQQVNTILQEHNLDLSESEAKALYGLTVLIRNDDGTPNVPAAFELFEAVGKAGANRILKGKKNVPRVPGGQAASKQPDLSSTAAKVAYATERLTTLNSDD